MFIATLRKSALAIVKERSPRAEERSREAGVESRAYRK
jgi:hypothetical protein